MGSRPRLLDLFCGAGGASVGYYRAGFDVEGVDTEFTANYPFTMHIADALTFPLDGYDVVTASPPCQHFSNRAKQWGTHINHPNLIAPVRARLQEWGGIYVMENIPAAPLLNPITLCGTTFEGLRIVRHRNFESNVPLAAPICTKHPPQYSYDNRKPNRGFNDPWQDCLDISGGMQGPFLACCDAVGINWMNRQELAEAIPPAFTEYIGNQLLGALTASPKGAPCATS